MHKFIMTLTKKAFEILPSSTFTVDLARLYPGMTQPLSYDKNTAQARIEISLLIQQLKELSSKLSLNDLEPAYSRLEKYLCEASSPITSSSFEELKYALENLLHDLYRYWDLDDKDIVAGTLTLLKKHFEICSEGVPLERGEYLRNEQGQWERIKDARSRVGSLADHLRHAIPLYVIYGGQYNDLALNFPPYLIDFHRNSHTVTAELFGYEMLRAFNQFDWQATALIEQFKTLCDHEKIQHPKEELIHLLEGALLFFRHESDADSIMSTKQDEVIVDIKMNLEKILTHIFFSLKHGDENDLSTIKSILNDLSQIRCGDGYQEVVSNILDLLKGEQLKSFDLAASIAEFRKSCCIALVKNHIDRSERDERELLEEFPGINLPPLLREGDHIHLIRYYSEIAEYHGVKIYKNEHEKIHNDHNVEELRPYFDRADAFFPRNNLNAKRSDLESFKHRFNKLFNECSLIDYLASKLDEYLLSLYEKFCNQFPDRQPLDYLRDLYPLEKALIDQFINCLEDNGMQKDYIPKDLLYQTVVYEKSYPRLRMQLRVQRDRIQSLKPLIVHLLSYRGCATLQNVLEEDKYPPINQFQIVTVILGQNHVLGERRQSLPHSLIPDLNILQWGSLAHDDNNHQLHPLAHVSYFIGLADESLIDNYESLIERIVSPSLMLEFIGVLQQNSIEEEEDDIEYRLNEISAISYNKYRQTIYSLHHRIISSQTISYLEFLQLNTPQELCEFIEYGLNINPKFILLNLNDVPQFCSFIYQGLSREDLKPQILKLVISIIEMTQLYYGSSETRAYDCKKKIFLYLIDTLSTAHPHLTADDIPKELIPFLPYPFLDNLINTVEDIQALFFDGRFYLFSQLHEVYHFNLLNQIVSLSDQSQVPEQLSYKLAQAHAEAKLKHNSLIIKCAHNAQSVNEYIILEDIHDILALLQVHYEIFKLHGSFYTLIGLLEADSFIEILDECLLLTGNKDLLLNIFNKIHEIAYRSQLRHPHNNLLIESIHCVSSRLFIPNLDRYENLAECIPLVYALFLDEDTVNDLFSEHIENFDDWCDFAAAISKALLYIPQNLLEIMQHHLEPLDSSTLTQATMNKLNPCFQAQISLDYVKESSQIPTLLALSLSRQALEAVQTNLIQYFIKICGNKPELDRLTALLFKHFRIFPEFFTSFLQALPLPYWNLMLQVSPLKLELPSFNWIIKNTPKERLEGFAELLNQDGSLARHTYKTLSNTYPASFKLLCEQLLNLEGEAYKELPVITLLAEFYVRKLSYKLPLPLPPTQARVQRVNNV